MKKIILLIVTILATTLLINAQPPTETPSTPGDTTVRDDNIKRRSVALERARQEMMRNNSSSPVRSDIDKKYPEIKEDFEGMQISQTAIIKAYTTGKSIDYKLIESSANSITKHAERLNSNLFTAKVKKKDKKDKEEKEETVRNLIIRLDGAIGAFTSSVMFKNLRVVDPNVAKKTQSNLMIVLETSKKLSETAKKMK